MTTERLSVAILVQYFYPEVPGAAQIATDLALGLKDEGFDVRVFTGQPSYWDSERLAYREDYRGVIIHRARSRRLSRSRLSREGEAGRLLNGAMLAIVTLFNLLRRGKPRVLLVDSTSPFLLVTAWLLRKLRRVPFVVVVHDVYPDIAVKLNIVAPRSLAERVWRQTYRRVYRAASRVVVLGPRMREVVSRSLAPRERGKCTIIPNWADGDVIVPRSGKDNPLRLELGLVDKLVVLYSGNMGPPHDMDTVLDAAERLRPVSDLRFLFIGDGGSWDRVSTAVKERELTNVKMLPYQPQEVLPYSLTCGDVSLVTLRSGMEGLLVPSKVYSSLAAGLAILAVMGSNSEIGDIVEQHDCGYRVTQGDVDGLTEVIMRIHGSPELLSDMKQRARACFEENYTRRMSIGRYVSLLRNVATAS